MIKKIIYPLVTGTLKVPSRLLSSTMLADTDGKFKVKRDESWSSCIATRKLFPGEAIGWSGGKILPIPTRFTVQLTPKEHLLIYGGLEYCNHSCNPNSKIVVYEEDKEIAFVSKKEIQSGEQITFNYNTTEWEMDEKFQCNCGSVNCSKTIAGLKFLTDKEIIKLLPDISATNLRNFVQSRLH